MLTQYQRLSNRALIKTKKPPNAARSSTIRFSGIMWRFRLTQCPKRVQKAAAPTRRPAPATPLTPQAPTLIEILESGAFACIQPAPQFKHATGTPQRSIPAYAGEPPPQGNGIKSVQTHVRLPESVGAPLVGALPRAYRL